MGTVLATALFWIATISAIVAQVMILRSSRRSLGAVGSAGGGATGGRARPIEWVFAIVPAVAVAVLLYFTWRAATIPPVIHVEFLPSGMEIGA